MKPIFTLLFLSTFFISAQAQDWVHQGSKWDYSWVSSGGPGYDEYIYTNDVVVAGHNCHKISWTDYSSNYSTDIYGGNGHYINDTLIGPSIYTYSNSDTTFFYYPGLLWQGVYFFGAHIGDTIAIPSSSTGLAYDTFSKALVDGTGIMLVDSAQLRFYTFHLIDSCPLAGHLFTGMAVERLGMMYNTMLPEWTCATDDYYYSFCSYQDDSFAVYQPDSTCRSLPTAIAEIPQTHFHCQPNPAQDEIQITFDENLSGAKLSIISIDGKEVLNQSLEKTENQISVSSLANGFYELTVTQYGNRFAMQKLIITH
jgi:hypothetical protein